MAVMRTLFGELSRSMKMISLTSALVLIVLSVIGYFVYKKYFSPLSKFKEYPNKIFSIEGINLNENEIFSVPITSSKDDVAKIILDYNKSNPVTKIDMFMVSRDKDNKGILLLSFAKGGKYSKSNLPPLTLSLIHI